MRRVPLGLALVAVLCCPPVLARAEDPPAPPPAAPPAAPPAEAPPPLATIESPSGRPLELEVVGSRPILGPDPVEGLRTIPGAGESLTTDEVLRIHQAVNLQEAVRGRPGIVIRPEDPSGVVMNVGFRGLNPDRSEKMLILEDGVFAGLAPYIENAAYYVPPFERMERIEVLKGSSQILYGPQTVGGVINLITPEIPLCPEGRVRAVYGSDDYMMGLAEAGGTHGRFGYLVTVVGKRGDGFRDHSEFDFLDLTGKFRWTFTPCTNVTLKLNTYDQDSQQSYLGLTGPMYADRRFQNPAKNDLLEVSWNSAVLTFQHRFRSDFQLLTNVYWMDAVRNWNRQDFARNTGFAAPPANTIETVGDVTVDGGAVFMRSSFGSRDRDFTYWGVEPRLIGTYCMLGRRHEFHVGMRWHDEKMIEERNNRANLALDPVTRDRDVREVDAAAFFGNTTVNLTDRLAVTPGLRVEAYESDRHFDVIAGVPTDLDGSTDDVQWLPGLGATYQLGRGVTAFAGVHRGFAPPRTAQAIDSTGADLDLEAELSWNYEAGFRGTCGNRFAWEATGFFLDFQNQVVPANQSGGASTANTNAGETQHIGFELAGTVDLLQMRRRGRPGCSHLWLEGGYTYVHTENVTPNGTFEGKELPYAPEHTGYVGVAWEPGNGWRFGAKLSYVGEQFADQANTVAANNEGTIGRLDDYWLLDATVAFRPRGAAFELTASVNNLLDEEYIASRAPEGIFPGAPTLFFLGLNVDF
jgi:Fe(3+) dicitrate transport protein